MHFIRLPRHVQNTPRAKRTNERSKPTAAGRQAAGSNRAPLMIIGVLQGVPRRSMAKTIFMHSWDYSCHQWWAQNCHQFSPVYSLFKIEIYVNVLRINS